MILSFADRATEDIFDGINSKEARMRLPRLLWSIAARKLDQIDSAVDLNDLKVPPGNRLEALKGNRAGQFRIRINEKFRICFEWNELGPEKVEVVDYH
ncbi:MAG TPA: type II toxin-antitoxin system RelE/ParE family toxin [Pyrinomonadaceae bacterium]|nr:type II toxin-antitoxin system RelE/ParE family toxin [Pyrinomonadaceae bacterium]